MDLSIVKQDVHSIAELFIILWEKVGGLPSYKRLTATSSDKLFVDDLNSLLKQDKDQDILDTLIELINQSAPPADKVGQVLVIMKVIDEFIYRIHPRAVVLPTALASIPKWLQKLRYDRYGQGFYGKVNEHVLLPRGPLLRSARDEFASSAESFADRFAALAVVKEKLNHESQSIIINSIFIGADQAKGVVSSSSLGQEKIAFIPIAEHADDLITAEHVISGQTFVDFRIHPTVNSADRLISALSQLGYADIAVAPELVMSESAADELPEKLRSFKPPPARMIVAGSGYTQSHDNGLPWNELRVFNGLGTELWRQRKIWPAGLSRDRALEFGLSDPGAGLVKEHNSSGVEIIVADVEELGRCVVLICQDIQSQPLSSELIRQFQPDWVFVPILDIGIESGRWGHQRAFDLSGLSNARFVLSTSTALAHKKSTLPKQPNCGLAVGPKSATKNDSERRYQCISVDEETSPGYALLEWKSDTWKKTTLT